MLCRRLPGNTAFLMIPLLGALSACGPVRDEGWNSYYYGADQVNRTSYDRYEQHNDDTYILPHGTWDDEQTPQGQKW